MSSHSSAAAIEHAHRLKQKKDAQALVDQITSHPEYRNKTSSLTRFCLEEVCFKASSDNLQNLQWAQNLLAYLDGDEDNPDAASFREGEGKEQAFAKMIGVKPK